MEIIYVSNSAEYYLPNKKLGIKKIECSLAFSNDVPIVH